MKLFAFALLAFAPVAGMAAAYGYGVDVAALASRHEAVTFTDRTGLPLGTVLASDSRHAVAVPLDRISPDFLRAIVAAEDARFYHHGAIDLAALARATRDYLVYGEARSGGSTIEMQLARLLHPTPSSIRGKFAQIAGAERIAIRSSKTAILEAYVNRVPMGGNLYGVEAASRTYFGEPAADLDLAQASLLAAIPNDPDGLAPSANWSALRARQRYVLAANGDGGRHFRARCYARVRRNAAPQTRRRRHHRRGARALCALSEAPAAAGCARRSIGPLQRFVQAQTLDVIDSLQSEHVVDAAALVVDNRTGAVLAYVGSPDYFADEALGRNDGVTALRQPGSSLKPFMYELALERRTILPTTILPDVPAAYAISGGKLYQPADYSGRFSGPVRVRYALANSLNAPAVHVLSSLGVGTFLRRLHELGFVHLTQPPSYYGLGLTLGGGEVSLWELAGAYATLARGGSAVPLHLLNVQPPAASRIGDPPTWALVTDMLADPHARAQSFGLHSVLEMPFPAAVKTGTSSDFRDTWTVGFTREYTVAVWVGNFDGSPMRGVSGVTGAGPLWNRIMLHLHERDDPPPFDPPPVSCASQSARRRVTLRSRTAQPSFASGCVPTTSLQCGVPRPRSRESTIRGLRCSRPFRAPSLRIVSPRGGDVFVANPVASALQAREQELALRAVDSGGRLRWTANGNAVPLDANGTAFWPIRDGTWTFEAFDGRARDRVTIRVVPAPPGAKPGFTFLKPRPCWCCRC